MHDIRIRESSDDMKEKYRIAGKNVEISSQYSLVHDMCREYVTEKEPDFMVKSSPADICFERKKSAAEDKRQGIPVHDFSDEYLETLAIYRQIAEQMIESDILLFHGSAIAVDGRGYLFTAKSGTGKSTHTRLWREVFRERALMVNDDKPLLGISDDGVTVYGTPWDGKHHLSSNIAVPLRAVCILERSRKNRVERIKFSDAYPLLLQQSYRSQDPGRLTRTMELLGKLGRKVPVYRLGCNMEREAALVAYKGIEREER